jgi:serine/alanine adding enzyme
MTYNTAVQEPSGKVKDNLEIITDSSKIDRKSWGDFVRNHMHGNVFQTPQMYDVFEQVDGFTPILIAACKNGKISGVLLAVIQKEIKGVPGILAKRAIIRGAP